jgi:hypothetical protein
LLIVSILNPAKNIITNEPINQHIYASKIRAFNQIIKLSQTQMQKKKMVAMKHPYMQSLHISLMDASNLHKMSASYADWCFNLQQWPVPTVKQCWSLTETINSKEAKTRPMTVEWSQVWGPMTIKLQLSSVEA